MTYSGHLHRRTALGSKGKLRFGYVDVTLDWTATATFPSQEKFQRGVPLHFTKLSGEIEASGTGNPAPKAAPIVDCKGSSASAPASRKAAPIREQRPFTTYPRAATECPSTHRPSPPTCSRALTHHPKGSALGASGYRPVRDSCVLLPRDAAAIEATSKRKRAGVHPVRAA